MKDTRLDLSEAASCPDWERMLDYFQAVLGVDEMAAVDDHFANCDNCIEEARSAHEYALALENWTARSHGDAWRRELIERALRDVSAAADRSLSERIGPWRRRAREAAAGAVELVVDLSGAKIVTQGLAGIVRADAWRFEPAGVVRSTQDQPVREAIGGENAWRIRAQDSGLIEIVAGNWPVGTTPPVVMVVDEVGDHAPFLVPLKHGPGNSLSGTFSTPQGSYLVVMFSENLPRHS